jgi:hypothetical protein
VPKDLQLPIKVTESIRREDVEELVRSDGISPAARLVADPEAGINDVNFSTFLYSWKTGLTTITSNWEAAKKVQRVIMESHVKTGEEGGPRLWHLRYAQKLLASPRPRSVDT